jgi:hypothetical protein
MIKMFGLSCIENEWVMNWKRMRHELKTGASDTEREFFDSLVWKDTMSFTDLDLW